MSQSTTTHIQVIGSKRSRTLSPDETTAASNGSGNVDRWTTLPQADNMDIESFPSSPLAKRRRRYAEHESPLLGTSFVSPAMSGTSSMDTFFQGDNIHRMEQQLTDSSIPCHLLSQEDDDLCWWKRKPKSTDSNNTVPLESALTTCHVCERKFPPLPVPKVKNIMPSNSLLAYFSMNNSKMTTATIPSTTETDASTCTFCERPCCQDCMTMCEECQHPFCSFCSTMDYRGHVERHLCLDCSSLLDLGRGGNHCSGDSSLMVMD